MGGYPSRLSGIGRVEGRAFRHQTLDLLKVPNVGELHERPLRVGQVQLSLRRDGHADGPE